MAPTARPQGSPPPPWWFAEFYPFFPLFVMQPRRPGRDQGPDSLLPCTLGHGRALETADHVHTILAALVALGHFDVRMFLDLYLRSDPPGKYLAYLRGRRALREDNLSRLDRAIEDLATSRFIRLVVSENVPCGGITSRRPFKDLNRVAEQVSHMPLLASDFLYLDGSHIGTCVPLLAGKRIRLVRWGNLWRKIVDNEAVDLGLGDQCRCHTMQRMFEEGDLGPPSELYINGRGGSGPIAARHRPVRESSGTSPY